MMLPGNRVLRVSAGLAGSGRVVPGSEILTSAPVLVNVCEKLPAFCSSVGTAGDVHQTRAGAGGAGRQPQPKAFVAAEKEHLVLA